MRRYVLTAVLAIMVPAIPAVASPIILVEDSFTDGDRTDGADPLDVAWYKVEEGAPGDQTLTVQNDDAGIGGGNALAVTHTATDNRRGMLANFSEVTLATFGDSISLSFDFRLLNNPLTNSKEDFRFGLLNSNGTVQDSDQLTDDIADDDVGYYIRASTGTQTEWSYAKERGTASFMAGGDLSQLLADQQLGGINDNLTHTVTMTLTLAEFESTTEPGTFFSGLDVAFVMDEGLAGEISMVEDDQSMETTGTATFNEVGFSSHDDDVAFIIDNISVISDIFDEPTQPTNLVFTQTSLLLSSATNGTDLGGFQTEAAFSRPWVYSRVAGAGDTDNTSFQIAGDRLLTAASLAGQGGTVLSFRAQTEDSGLFFQSSFQVTVEADTDDDGLSDTWELGWAPGDLGALDGDDVADADSDGLTDLEEFQLWYSQGLAVDPLDDDTDDDTLLDGDEIAGAGSRPPTDPTLADTDGEGLDDDVETDTGVFIDSTDTGTDPTDVDTDGDTLEDDVEQPTGVYVSPADPGTHPLTPDSDGDGLTDGEEINDHSTDPVDWDSDDDTAGDGLEEYFFSDPNSVGSVPSGTFWPVAKQTWTYPDMNNIAAQVTWEQLIDDVSTFGTQIELQRGEQLVLAFDVTGHEGGDADDLDIRLGFGGVEGFFTVDGYLNPAIDVGPPAGTTALIRYRNGSTVYGSTLNNQTVASSSQIPANGGVVGATTVNSVVFSIIRSDLGYTAVLQWEEIVLEATMTPIQYWSHPLWDKFFIRLFADSGDLFNLTNISVTYGDATAPLIRPVALTDLAPVTSPAVSLQFAFPTDLGSSGYELQGSSDLTNPGAWAPVLSGIPVGGATDTVSTVVVPAADVSPANRSYRIVVP